MGRRTIVLVVALLLAGLAAFAVWNYLSNIEAEVRGEVELVPVYRASVFIPAGSDGSLVLSQDQAVLSESERQFLPQNAITDEETLRASLQGRVAAGPISQNQILTTDQWVSLTADLKPLATIIPEGKQAISIQVDEVRGVSGFIRPGDRVNLIVTISMPTVELDVIGADQSTEQVLADLLQRVAEVQEQEITRFVLQGIPVLAVDRQLRSEEGEQVVTPPPVPGEEAPPEQRFTGIFTLEVTAEEAEKIAFSFEKGSVWLTLVPEDFVPVPTDGVTRDTLFD